MSGSTSILSPGTFGRRLAPGRAPGSLVVRGPRPWVDVTAYGAVGDPVADDTAAIAAAVAPVIKGNYAETLAAISGGSGNAALIDLDGASAGDVAGVVIDDNMLSILSGITADAIRVKNSTGVDIDRNRFVLTQSGSRGIVPTTGATGVYFGPRNRLISGAGSLVTGALASSVNFGGQIVTQTEINSTVGTGATQYMCPGVGSPASTENTRQTVIPKAGTVRKLQVVTNTAQDAGGPLVVTLRKNGVDQAVTFTIAAGAAAGTYSDVTNSVSFAAGDLLSIKLANNSGVGASAALAGFGFEFIDA